MNESMAENIEVLQSPVEIVKISSEAFTKLKDEMYISDQYEKTLRDLATQDKVTVLAVQRDGRYVGRVMLRHDWTDNSPKSGASVVIEDEFPGLPQVNALEIDEQYRRRGLAQQLMQSIEMVSYGFSQIGLGVEISNTPAMKLYEKLGYRYEKIRGEDTYDIWFGDPDPKVYKLYLMVKDLKREQVQ